MSDFRQASKILRYALMLGITEEMTQDPAVRFAHMESLNSRMLDLLGDINNRRPGVKDDFDQIRVTGGLFGDGNPSVRKHLVDATEFIQQLKVTDPEHVKVGVTIERRDWWLPPVLHAFTLSVGEASATFTDDGESHEPK
jgi:hypothetical protein